MRHHFRILTQMAFAIVLLSSCTRTIYQEREVVRRDSLYITSASVDTLVQRDSIMVRESGDTVFKTVYKYIYKVRERTDTMFVERTDTVTNNVTKIEEKTRYKKDWLSIIGALCIGILTGIITLPVIRFFADRGRTQSVSSLPPPERKS